MEIKKGDWIYYWRGIKFKHSKVKEVRNHKGSGYGGKFDYNTYYTAYDILSDNEVFLKREDAMKEKPRIIKELENEIAGLQGQINKIKLDIDEVEHCK